VEVPGGSNANNCSFHQFAWQGFLDLVQPVSGQPGRTFETFMPEYGIFVGPGVPVTPWGQSPVPPCGPADGPRSKRLFVRPRVPKGAGFDPDSEQQAGLPGGPPGSPLYDQTKQIVHYSISVNRVEYDFIVQCNFKDTTCVTSAPRSAAITPGAIELKTSWRLFTGATPRDMYTIKGFVAGPGRSGKASTCKPVTLGLVGFHLVANTPLHPEFVWATFEHRRNAPDCTNPQKTPPGGWSFNNPNCPSCAPNQPKVNPTQVCRVAPAGGGAPSPSGGLPDNVVNIRALNASVHETLSSLLESEPKRYAAMAIWQNYDLTGNIWTLNGALPPTDTNQRGSLLAANTTLETFVQGQSAQGQNQNCFTCHTLGQFVMPPSGTKPAVPMGFPTGAPANLSHLWGFAQQTGGCNSGKGPLPAACPLVTRAEPPAAPPRTPSKK
jgi:hypothetical protein